MNHNKRVPIKCFGYITEIQCITINYWLVSNFTSRYQTPQNFGDDVGPISTLWSKAEDCRFIKRLLNLMLQKCALISLYRVMLSSWFLWISAILLLNLRSVYLRLKKNMAVNNIEYFINLSVSLRRRKKQKTRNNFEKRKKKTHFPPCILAG